MRSIYPKLTTHLGDMLSNSNSRWPEAPSSTLTGPGWARSRDMEAAVEDGWGSEVGGWRSRDTGPVMVQ